MENSINVSELVAIELLLPNIVICEVKQNWHIQKEELEQVFNTINQKLDEKYHLVWVMETKIQPGKGVMDRFANPKRAERMLSEVFCIKTTLVQHLGNLYLKMKKPIVPSAIVKNKKEAIAWIEALQSEKEKAS